jgi:hypothetical protein
MILQRSRYARRRWSVVDGVVDGVIEDSQGSQLLHEQDA